MNIPHPARSQGERVGSAWAPGVQRGWAAWDGGGTKGKGKGNDAGSSITNVEDDREGEKFLRGFAPARRGPFVSAKGPKTMGARAWPFGCLCPGPEG